MLELVEDDEFIFDVQSADRPVRWIEKFCRFSTGELAGQPFLLHPAQKQIIRDVFGWKVRKTGLRRFTDVYFEAGIGSGKSPTLAALGLYCLGYDNEPGATVFSLASNYEQAKVVFKLAKDFIRESPELQKHYQVLDKKITHTNPKTKNKSEWKVLSGNISISGTGPHLILGDECHEWRKADIFDSLHNRQSKRQQPLCIIATNAAKSTISLCGQLHQKAMKCLDGEGPSTLYPIIWAAPSHLARDDPQAWRAANQLLGTTISEEKVKKKFEEMEAIEFDRLYLSRWPKVGADGGINMGLWDACSTAFDPATLKEVVQFGGIDLADGNDLCASVGVYATGERFYVDAHFWMTQENADRYEQKYMIPYNQWAKDGHITLVQSPTINDDYRKWTIAGHIAAKSKQHKTKVIGYDRYKADQVVATLEASGLTCVPIPQGFTLSAGCVELERRLKEGSITIAPNPVFRFCAENTQFKEDDRGNMWPMKPNARGRYAGRRERKIDGVTALVTALVEARKHTFSKKTSTPRAFSL